MNRTTVWSFGGHINQMQGKQHKNVKKHMHVL